MSTLLGVLSIMLACLTGALLWRELRRDAPPRPAPILLVTALMLVCMGAYSAAGVVLAALLAYLAGRLVWRGLGKTALPKAARVALTALAAAACFVALYWLSLYISVLLFLWQDRPGQ